MFILMKPLKIEIGTLITIIAIKEDPRTASVVINDILVYFMHEIFYPKIFCKRLYYIVSEDINLL